MPAIGRRLWLRSTRINVMHPLDNKVLLMLFTLTMMRYQAPCARWLPGGSYLIPGSSVIGLGWRCGWYAGSDAAQQQSKHDVLWQRAGKAGLKGITEGSQLPYRAPWQEGV